MVEIWKQDDNDVETLAFKILQHHGLDNITFLYNGTDYLIALVNMEKERLYVKMLNYDTSMTTGTELYAVMSINQILYTIKIVVENVVTTKMGDILCTRFIDHIDEQLHKILDDMLEYIKDIQKDVKYFMAHGTMRKDKINEEILVPENRKQFNQDLTKRILYFFDLHNETLVCGHRDYRVKIVKIRNRLMKLESQPGEIPLVEKQGYELTVKVHDEIYKVTFYVNHIIYENEIWYYTGIISREVDDNLQHILDDVQEYLNYIDERSDRRIVLNDSTLMTFPIVNRLVVNTVNKDYIGFIKNISMRGINFVTTDAILHDDFKNMVLGIEFNDPPESIKLAGEVVRQNQVEVNDVKLVDFGMCLEANFYLENRIIEYIGMHKNTSDTWAKP